MSRASIAQSDVIWQEAVSTSGNFRATFPGIASHKLREISTPFGPAHEDRYDLAIEGEHASYHLIAAKSADPPEFLKNQTLKERINSFVDSSASAYRSQYPGIDLEVKRHDVNWHGFPGERVRIVGRHSGGWIDTQIQCIYVGDDCYFCEALQNGVSQYRQLSEAEVAKFLDSFQLVTVPGRPSNAVEEGSLLTHQPDWFDLIDAASIGRWTNSGGHDVFKLSKDGSLRASGGRSYLISPRAYDDFELSGRMKVSRGGNGGIFFGVPPGSDMHTPLGYEVQLYVRKSGNESGTAELWLDGKPIRTSLHSFDVPDRWYSFHILHKGGSLLVKIDDTVVHNLGAEHRAGHIALQCYSHEGEVHYTDLKIRDLSARHGSVSDARANPAADEARIPALPEPAGGSLEPEGESSAELRRDVNDKAEAAGVTTGELRTWTDSTGTRTIKAEYVAADEQRVQIRLQNGKVVTSRLERFSKQDQEFVREMLKSTHKLRRRLKPGAIINGDGRQPGFGTWICRLEISEVQDNSFAGYLHLDSAKSGRAEALIGASLEIEGQLQGSEAVQFTVTGIERQSRHRGIVLKDENIGLVYRGAVRGDRIVGRTSTPGGSSAGSIAMQFICPPENDAPVAATPNEQVAGNSSTPPFGRRVEERQRTESKRVTAARDQDRRQTSGAQRTDGERIAADISRAQEEANQERENKRLTRRTGGRSGPSGPPAVTVVPRMSNPGTGEYNNSSVFDGEEFGSSSWIMRSRTF
jgi:hypothetical protein